MEDRVRGPQARSLHKGTPFCRDSELHHIAELLDGAQSQTVFVDGHEGMGITSLLQAVSQWAAERRLTLEVFTTPSLAGIPFGALRAAIHPGDIYTQQTPVDMYRDIYAYFSALPQGAGAGQHGGPLIIVDGAESLDVESAMLISDMVRGGVATAVLSHNSARPLPTPLPDLWRNGLAEMVTLQALGSEAAVEFCQGILGGRMVEASAQTICRIAAGNPRLMKIMIVGALASGQLRQSNGRWLLDPLFRLTGQQLNDVVRERLQGMAAEESTGLELVALSEPVERLDIAGIVGEAAVQALHLKGLVQERPEEPGLLRVTTPLYGQAIRNMVPKTRSKILHGKLTHTAGKNFANPEALLRHTVWTIESGEPVPDSQLIRAGVYACRTSQIETALRLAQAIQGREHSARAAYIRSRAKYLAGDYAGAFKAIRPVSLAKANLEDLLAGALLREMLQISQGNSTDSSRVEARTIRAAAELLARKDPGNARNIIRRTSDMARLIEMLALSRDGCYVEMEEPLEELLAGVPHPEELEWPMNRAVALALDAERLTAVGRPLDGMKQAKASLQALPAKDHESMFLPELIMGRCYTASVAAGKWAEVEELLLGTAVEGESTSIGYQGSGSLVRGLVLLRQGRAESALEVLAVGIESIAHDDPAQLFSFSTALAYFAAAQLGLGKAAERYGLMHQRGVGMYLIAAHERAFMAAGSEFLYHDGEGLTQLGRLADEAHARKLPTVELDALVLALDHGPAVDGERLRAVAGSVQGNWGKAMVRYAEAVDSPTAAVQLASAQHLATSQMFQQASQLYVLAEATALSNREGRMARAARAGAARARQSMGPANANSEPEEILKGAVAVLTHREHQIAVMAAQGRSDAEIAQILNLSTRTVEGHLYRCYSKLNITSRNELQPALLA